MTRRHDEDQADPAVKDPPSAVSVGDGSLGGAALGGSVTGPGAGEIHDDVGPEVAVPVQAPPDPPPTRDDPTVEPSMTRPTDRDEREP